MQTKVLVVDSDQSWLQAITDELGSDFEVESCSTFAEGRAALLAGRPDLLIANIRLNRYNGIYFGHLIRSLGLSTHCILYGLPSDVGLAREAQAAGAWFEPSTSLIAGLRTHMRTLMAPGAPIPRRFTPTTHAVGAVAEPSRTM